MTSSSPTAPTWPQVGLRRGLLLLLLLSVIAFFVLSLALGSVAIPLPEIVKILLGAEPERATWTSIILRFRLPKALTALLAGAALSVSGLQMQTMFRNPLAGPFVLGINAGASLGVALIILTAGAGGSLLVSGLSLAGLGLWGDFSLALAASLGAGLVLLLVLLVARRVTTTTLLVLGLLFGYGASALVSLLLYFSLAERIQAYITWTFGSFAGVTWSQMRVLAPAVFVGLVLAWGSAKPLNALLLGEDYARTLGVSVRRTRTGILLSASLLAGTVTAFCGPIAFLGVAVPHLCRSLFATADHRLLVPTTLLMGGLVALAADLAAALPGSQVVLPLNAVTALLGAPIIAWVILRRQRLLSRAT